MKSTSGAHFLALDHIRAAAALMVFVWHFIHGQDGFPVPFDGSPPWGPLVLLDEGHVGVALFMTLSGYLFAKLLDGKRIIFHLFLWNRILRLFPLLLLVMALNAVIEAIRGSDVRAIYWYALSLPKGFVFPTWPNGGWSIAAELHFYLLLPLLLVLKRRLPSLLVLIIVFALTYRGYVYAARGEVQSIAYWTILGRIDQFIFGILAFHFVSKVKGRHALVIISMGLFLSVYYWFNVNGGFYRAGNSPVSPSIWIWFPTVEGVAFAIMIAWYDTSFKHSNGRISRFFARVGEYSYSIYLLHFFVVFSWAEWINANVLDLGNPYLAMLVSILAFAALIPVGYLSMRYVESPFLRVRRPYYVKE